MADKMTCCLGVDFGGGASKATLLRADGEVLAVATAEYPTYYPGAGWVEQNPDEWFGAARANISAVLAQSGVSPGAIAAVCLDAATHTAVLTDEAFRALRPAIHWTDTRSAAEAAFLQEAYGDLIGKQAYHLPGTIWTLPQLLWVKRHEPEVWAKTKRILFAKDYVRHRLTGDYATDYIEAQGSMLFDFERMAWSPELCAILGIDAGLLPPVAAPGDFVGAVTGAAAEQTGLLEGTPVICGTTDTVMEVFASGAARPGQMTVKLATAGRICVITERAYPHPHLVNYSHVQKGLWYPGTATKSCAASYRWYRDAFGGAYRDLDRAAAQVPPGCGGLLYHPYLNGELTPYGDPSLCASFTGIRAGHTKAHFSRAVLEGVALSLLDCKQALEEIGIPHEQTAAVIGGGAKSPLWRQILADTLGITLVRGANSDSSFGSAMLAGVSAGMFESLSHALDACVKEEGKTVPDSDNTRIYQENFQIYKEIQAALAPIYQKR